MGQNRRYKDYALRDLVDADKLFNAGSYNSTGLFCQQAVEKYLKEFLEVYGEISEVKYLFQVHNLRSLYRMYCSLINHEIDKLILAELSLLTDYYYGVRYPSEDPIEIDKEMAKDALDFTKKFIQDIEKNLQIKDKKIKIFP